RSEYHNQRRGGISTAPLCSTGYREPFFAALDQQRRGRSLQATGPEDLPLTETGSPVALRAQGRHRDASGSTLPLLVGGGAHDVSSRTLLARKYFEVEMVFRWHDRARDEVGEGTGQCHRVVEVDPVDPRVCLIGELQLDNPASTIRNRATCQVTHMSYRLDACSGCLAN